MLDGRERRARPMDLGPAREPVEANLNMLPEVTWIQPLPDDPAEVDPAVPARDDAARPRRRAAAPASATARRAHPLRGAALAGREVAELLETSVASVNSALQRARATLEASELDIADTARAR